MLAPTEPVPRRNIRLQAESGSNIAAWISNRLHYSGSQILPSEDLFRPTVSFGRYASQFTVIIDFAKF
jgi:hypothetical protein